MPTKMYSSPRFRSFPVWDIIYVCRQIRTQPVTEQKCRSTAASLVVAAMPCLRHCPAGIFWTGERPRASWGARLIAWQKLGKVGGPDGAARRKRGRCHTVKLTSANTSLSARVNGGYGIGQVNPTWSLAGVPAERAGLPANRRTRACRQIRRGAVSTSGRRQPVTPQAGRPLSLSWLVAWL